jgi:flagellar biosynthesis/type III secretory pathway M-ring protein FliF/YscJ
VATTNRYAQLYCFYAAYMVNFLRRGLGVTDESNLQILDSHDNQSISFSRGAVLSELSPAMELDESLTIEQIRAIIILSVLVAALIAALICCCVRRKIKAKRDEQNKQELMQDWDGDGEPEDAAPAAQEVQQQPGDDFFGAPEEHQVDPVLHDALEKIEGQVGTP